MLRSLIIGDILAILVMTLIGFWFHYREIRGWRWLTTFFPVLIAWFAIAPWLGVYRMDLACSGRHVWRPALAALLSAPLAAWLRAVWLNAAIVPVTAIAPIFVLVLGLTDALGFLIWRFLWVTRGFRTISNWFKTNQ